MARPIMCELARQDCLVLLGRARVGRLGLSMRALPVVLPVNFVVVDGEVVFRTAEGTKLHAAAAGAIVAFEADGYEPSGRSGWSVLVQGPARVVDDPAAIDRLSSLCIEAWAADAAADRFVAVATDVISGRRFARCADRASVGSATGL
jgi:nitroimidazol reductase NimA-like FMN-containing flavoprotein (pyridoxamine 5'-phosphate oxidase superfamily)